MSLLRYIPIVVYFLLEFLRRDPIKESKQNSGSSLLIGIAFMLMIVIPPQINILVKTGVVESILLYVGIFIGLLGVLIRFTAMRTLGRFYSRNVSIQGEHQLIQEGWYKYIRHPGYLGTFITFLGYSLTAKSWLAIPVNIVLFFSAYLYRIHVEEKALISQFGEEYRTYREKTWRIIPFIY